MADLMQKKNYDALTQNPEFAGLLSTLAMQDLENGITESSVLENKWQDVFEATNILGFLKKNNFKFSKSKFYKV